jgi:hypothetical protein
MKTVAVSVLLLFTSLSLVYGQNDLVFGDTANTNTAPSNKQLDKSQKSRKIVLWIKNDSKGLLIGNPCMEDVLQEMGFNYLIQFKGKPGQKKALARYIHNKGVKTTIFFRNGPFWRMKLNKKRRECRLSTRDFVG